MKIALIAHDGKKAEMVSFLRDQLELFKREDIELISTGTTGTFVEKAGLSVKRVLSGPLGGDAQIGAEVAESLSKDNNHGRVVMQNKKRASVINNSK